MGQLCSVHSFIRSFIPLVCAECDDSSPFSRVSSIPIFYVLFPATLLHQPFFHPLTPHLAICFLVYLSVLLFANSYMILFWEFCFLSIPCTYRNQRNLFNLIVSVMVGFLTLALHPLKVKFTYARVQMSNIPLCIVCFKFIQLPLKYSFFSSYIVY